MDYQKEYSEAKEWYRKASIMSLYHTYQCLQDKSWTLRDTAIYFGVSIGLVSENIKLAKSLETNSQLMKAPNRQEALKLIERRNGIRVYFEDTDDE